MSEGMSMALVILFVFIVFLPSLVIPQIRRESKWREEDMVDPERDKKAQEEDKDTRDF